MKNNTITVKNELPELLAAVCNHKDCPQWLADDIWEAFNNRTNGSIAMTVNYFRYMLEQVKDVPDCYSCGQPIFQNALAWHKTCEQLQPEVVQ